VAYPPGVATDAPLPVVVALHASSGNHETVFSGGLAMDRFLAMVVGEGLAPFAVASVDGNGSWLPRPGGIDSGRTVTEELVPMLSDRGLDVGRLAFMGWSAGGYGALLLGATYGEPVSAVAVTSPALTTDDVPQEVDVYAQRSAYSTIPLRVDCGHGDPFYHAVKDYIEGIDPPPAGGFGDGGHTHGYWRRMAPAQLRFIGEHLA
jgi:dienelactone hydrolase